jgi:hypothetical protein
MRFLYCILILPLLASCCINDGIVPPKNYPFPDLVKRHPQHCRMPLGTPRYYKILNKAPDGPYGFRVGFRDGCDTAITGLGGNVYKSILVHRKDYIFMQKDPDYGVGWSVAAWWCGRYAEISKSRFKEQYTGFR